MRTLAAATATALLLPVAASAQETIGAFQYTHQTDPITDADRSYIFTRATENDNFTQAAFGWRCAEDGLQILALVDEYLGTDPRARVIYRIDDAPPSDMQRWPVTTSGDGLFVPDDVAETLTQTLQQAERIVIRAYDYKRAPHTVTFAVNGLSDALERLSCYNG